MKIEIIAPTRIEVDGVDAGTVMTYARAHPELQAEIDQAFIDWHASHVKATAAADAARDKTVADAQAATTQATAERDSAQAAVGAAFAALSNHPVIAGNDKARKLREAQAAAAQAAANLKALEG